MHFSRAAVWFNGVLIESFLELGSVFAATMCIHASKASTEARFSM